jgi:hypothetical protein
MHITDVYKTRVVEAMLLYALGYLKGSRYRGVLASKGGGKPAPMWVIEKTREKSADEKEKGKEIRSQAKTDLGKWYPEVKKKIEEDQD